MRCWQNIRGFVLVILPNKYRGLLRWTFDDYGLYLNSTSGGWIENVLNWRMISFSKTLKLSLEKILEEVCHSTKLSDRLLVDFDDWTSKPQENHFCCSLNWEFGTLLGNVRDVSFEWFTLYSKSDLRSVNITNVHRSWLLTISRRLWMSCFSKWIVRFSWYELLKRVLIYNFSWFHSISLIIIFEKNKKCSRTFRIKRYTLAK